VSTKHRTDASFSRRSGSKRSSRSSLPEQQAVDKVNLRFLTYNCVHLESALDVLIQRLHECPGVNSLALHALEPEDERAVVEIFLKIDHLYNVFALWIVVHHLAL